MDPDSWRSGHYFGTKIILLAQKELELFDKIWLCFQHPREHTNSHGQWPYKTMCFQQPAVGKCWKWMSFQQLAVVTEQTGCWKGWPAFTWFTLKVWKNMQKYVKSIYKYGKVHWKYAKLCISTIQLGTWNYVKVC